MTKHITMTNRISLSILWLGATLIFNRFITGTSGLLIPTSAPHTGAFPLPYGASKGDTASPRPADNNCPTSYDFAVEHQGGRQTSKIYVCTNGAISFDRPLPDEKPQGNRHQTSQSGYKYDFVAPYFADIKLEAGSDEPGRIWSRLIADTSDAAMTFVTDLINAEYWDANTQTEAEKIKPVAAVQVTWSKVRFATTALVHKDLESTFQAILVRDSSSTTYAIFIYGRLEWATAPFALPAMCAFQDDRGFFIFESFHNSGLFTISRHVTAGTNIHSGYSNGVWIYKLHTGFSGIVESPSEPKVGESCEMSATDYCNKDIKLAKCTAVSGNNVCQCAYGSVPTKYKKSCTCPAGKQMLEHAHDPFFHDAPRYSCTPANVWDMSTCDYPTSSKACDQLPNGHCDATSKRCVCDKGYYRKRHSVDLPNVQNPLYTCERAEILSPCESPFSAQACDDLPNSRCRTEDTNPLCGCLPGFYLNRFANHHECLSTCTPATC